MRDDITLWTQLFVNRLLEKLSDREVRSVTLFGSWTGSGPLWKESDLDLIVVPSAPIGIAFLRGVTETVALCADNIPYPIAPVIRGFNEIPAMLGPMTAALYSQSARTIYGEDLLPLFCTIASSYPTLELQRSALCALSLTRERIRTIAATQQEWLQKLEMKHTTYRSLLREFLGAVRCAFWTETANFANDFAIVLPQAKQQFMQIAQLTPLIDLIYQELIDDRAGEQHVKIEDVFVLTEHLTNHVIENFLVRDHASELRLHMNF